MDENLVPVFGEKGSRGPELQQDNGLCKAGTPSTLKPSFTLPQPAPLGGYSPLGLSQPCVHFLDGVSGFQPGVLSSPETHRKGISG